MPQQSVWSTQWVRVGVQAASDPTMLPVSMGFFPEGAEPVETGFVAAQWEGSQIILGNISYWVARCLVGPDGVTSLALGDYVEWLKIDAPPETVMLPVPGRLVIA